MEALDQGRSPLVLSDIKEGKRRQRRRIFGSRRVRGYIGLMHFCFTPHPQLVHT